MSGVLSEARLVEGGGMGAGKTGGLVFWIRSRQRRKVCARCFVALCEGGGGGAVDKGRAGVCVWHEER